MKKQSSAKSTAKRRSAKQNPTAAQKEALRLLEMWMKGYDAIDLASQEARAGNAFGVGILAALGQAVALELQELTASHPALVKEAASKEASWPSLVYPDLNFTRLAHEVMTV